MNNILLGFVACIVSALIGGAIFLFLNLPIPWLLGPIAAIVVG